MSEKLRIDRVTKEDGTWSNRFGEYQGYDLDLVKESEEVEIGVGNNRKLKPGGGHFEPKVGEEVWGNIVPDGRGGQKLEIDNNRMKDEPPDGSGPSQTSSRPSSSPQNSSRGSSGGETDWTVRNAEIRRQHSQDMSLRWLGLLGKAAEIEDVAKLADWFDRDVIATGKRASSYEDPGASAHPPAEKPRPSVNFPASELPDDSQEHLAHLMEKAGLHSVGSNAIAAWMFNEESLEPAKAGARKKIEARLEDPATQADQLGGLKTLFESRTATLLPEPSDLSDIPF